MPNYQPSVAMQPERTTACYFNMSESISNRATTLLVLYCWSTKWDELCFKGVNSFLNILTDRCGYRIIHSSCARPAVSKAFMPGARPPRVTKIHHLWTRWETLGGPFNGCSVWSENCWGLWVGMDGSETFIHSASMCWGSTLGQTPCYMPEKQMDERQSLL